MIYFTTKLITNLTLLLWCTRRFVHEISVKNVTSGSLEGIEASNNLRIRIWGGNEGFSIRPEHIRAVTETRGRYHGRSNGGFIQNMFSQKTSETHLIHDYKTLLKMNKNKLQNPATSVAIGTNCFQC